MTEWNSGAIDPMDEWVDTAIDAAVASGLIDALIDLAETNAEIAPDHMVAVIEAATASSLDRESDTGDGRITPNPLEVQRVRDLIRAKVRRHPAAPYADASFQPGAAAELREEYVGEDVRVGFRASDPNLAQQSTTVTRYSADVGGQTSIAAGRILDAQQNPVDGYWGYVVDAQTGALLLFDPAEVFVTNPQTGARLRITEDLIGYYGEAGWKLELTHHSSPVAGGPVKGAGTMRLEHGKIIQFSDESGHYRPHAEQQFEAMKRIEEEGADLSRASVILSGRDMGVGLETDKAEWLAAAADANPYFPTDEITLRADQFRQTYGDEFQIRAKMAVNEQIAERGQTVPAAEGTGTQTPTADEIIHGSVAVEPPSNIGAEPADRSFEQRLFDEEVPPPDGANYRQISADPADRAAPTAIFHEEVPRPVSAGYRTLAGREAAKDTGTEPIGYKRPRRDDEPASAPPRRPPATTWAEGFRPD